MVQLSTDDFIDIMNENGKLKSDIDAVKHACNVFISRNPRWIKTASKDEYRTLVMAILSTLHIKDEEYSC